MQNPHFLDLKLKQLQEQNRLRSLPIHKPNDIDFASNDYLGVVKNKLFHFSSSEYFAEGSTGSRLISGTHPITLTTEQLIAQTHGAEAALLFNSGYDANLGLFSCIAEKGDTIIYDEYIHASIRDGIRLSFAYSFFFQHNNLYALEKRLQQAQGKVFVAIESVYSMDGDMPDLITIVALCKKYNAYLIVDEAHAFGVIGTQGEGLVAHLGLAADCFARIYTYGKALGLHGATIVGSTQLIQYLINAARSFIYTTALPPAQVFLIQQAYEQLPLLTKQKEHLQTLITFFQQQECAFDLLKSRTPIQGIKIPNNRKKLLHLCQQLQEKGFFVLPIRYPTVAEHEERIRICLHSFNTQQQIKDLFTTLKMIEHTVS